jgi:hypothetical protein
MNDCTPATYTQLTGKVIDLGELTAEDHSFLWEAYERSRCRTTDPHAFGMWFFGAENPLRARSVQDAQVLRELLTRPLVIALFDLEMRLNILLGRWGRGDLLDIEDPFADTFETVAEAAAQRNVTSAAVYKAANRGDIVVTRERPAMVSVNSIRTWHISEVKRAAGIGGGRPKRPKSTLTSLTA